MTIGEAATWATTISLPVGALGLAFAAYQTFQARKAAAAGVLIAASEGFRSTWAAFFAAGENDRVAAFADLLNLIEASCAVHRDGLLVGRSGAALESYLVNILVQIDQSELARDLFQALVETDRTFEEIQWFLMKQRRKRRRFAERLVAHRRTDAGHLSPSQ